MGSLQYSPSNIHHHPLISDNDKTHPTWQLWTLWQFVLIRNHEDTFESWESWAERWFSSQKSTTPPDHDVRNTTKSRCANCDATEKNRFDSPERWRTTGLAWPLFRLRATTESIRRSAGLGLGGTEPPASFSTLEVWEALYSTLCEYIYLYP